ncbi:M48 family metallopeptidase [Ureibacillus aquaedulcis]|uniref:Ankyrin repeat domain-containing protein n=1 Tax=Ureibacillus aquaedulcis TaxID=3058421 RepID=A0ABT8GQ62_9BACL|nr:ankyrin repeat domain-containing protein [Ureibacillus sp. BA0131]MDN4493565.1 ankyrin repeat domain-containing protein [Ureibacillus sp. BA0131]
MKEHSVLPNELIHRNENKFFWLVLIISIITYVVLALSIVGIAVLVILMLLSFFFSALMIGNIRSNAVKISAEQFPEVFGRAEELCRKMEINKVPDIYVMQSGGILNAFATRFFGRNMVVIYAEIFELINMNGEDELNFVLAHELAHIKRNHLSKQMLILPAMWIPGIAELYLRACEYTCDCYAAYYTENSAAAQNSLTMLAIGKQLYQHVNKEQYMKQLNEEKGFFVWLSQALSTHPPLPKRIDEIVLFFGERQERIIEPIRIKALWIIISGSLAGLILLVFMGISYVLDTFLLSEPMDYYEDEEYTEEDAEISPFILAVANGEIDQVSKMIKNGEDVYQEDYYGSTALDWAVKSGNPEMVELLLASGADANYESSYGMTALMTAAEIADPEMVKLMVESGGDPNYQDYSGYTALTYAVQSSDLETVQALLDLGADPNLTDSENMNAYMVAIQSGEREIGELLKKYK